MVASDEPNEEPFVALMNVDEVGEAIVVVR